MKKYLFFLLISLAGGTKSYAQFTRYIILLNNKAGTPYSLNNPIQFLTQRSIDRRTRYSIPIDSTDLPIPPAYIDSILAAGNVTLLNTSKWLNQVCIRTTDTAALNKINTFPFVITTSPIAARPVIQPATTARPAPSGSTSGNHAQARPDGIPDYYSYGVAYTQINLNEGQFLHNHGFTGTGMILTMTDDGFHYYQTLPAFDSIQNSNRFLGTWNFVNCDSDVNASGDHGTECLSTIATNVPGTFVGTAPNASFYLFQSEDPNSEYPVEEQNWAAAAEKADSLGTDVISISLGYVLFDSSQFNHTYADLNGHTTIIARAANHAAAKGILVVVAAGNSGASPPGSWHYIYTPADADSALTVGAVDTAGNTAFFTSYGPNSSGQIKPDVAAVGANTEVIYPYTDTPFPSNGTSFATPIIAGLSTCLWEAFPEVNNMNIINILHKAGNRANNPDDRVGYGIPDMKNAFVLLIQQLHTFQSTASGTSVTLNWSAKSASDMNFVVERKLATDTNYQPIDTQSANTNFQTNSFSYTDNLAANEAYSGVSYRLKMNIAADTSFYLDSVTIPSSNGEIVVAPNPVSENLTITIIRSSTTRIDINLFTAEGRKMYSLTSQQSPGTGTYTIPFKNLAGGTYFAVIYCNNQKFATEKIVHR
jgi:serine protease AprX